MNILGTQFAGILRKIRLSTEERARIKSALLSHMVLTPIVVQPMVTAAPSRKSWKRKAFRRTLPLTLIGLLLAGASVSYAAEKTVPGDKLYPVKIHVNERARRALAVTDVAQAETEANFAARRLNEAVILAQESKLDDNTKTELKKQFTEHKNNFTEKVERVRGKSTKNAEKITKDFKGLIKERHNGLQALDLRDDDDEDDSSSDTHSSSTSTTVSASTTLEKNDDKREGKREDVRRNRDNGGQNVRGRDHDEDDEGDDEDEEDDNEHGGTPKSPTQTPASPTTTSTSQVTTSYSLADIATHNTPGNCYTAINGRVYNLSNFGTAHPGGEAAITSLCGTDGTSAFASQHGGQGKPERTLATHLIGVLR